MEPIKKELHTMTWDRAWHQLQRGTALRPEDWNQVQLRVTNQVRDQVWNRAENLVWNQLVGELDEVR